MKDNLPEDIDKLLKSVKSKYLGGKNMEKDIIGKVTSAIVVVALVILGFTSYFVVEPGEVAVKTRLGKVIGSYEEGLHFKMPLIESIIKFSIQIQRADIKTQAFSKDLQTMTVHLVVNHRIQNGTVVSIYRNLGPNYVGTIVDPIVQEIFKSISAKFSAEAVIFELLVTPGPSTLERVMLSTFFATAVVLASPVDIQLPCNPP